jgi:8-oxo-dGTP diphosphatase
MIEVAAAIIENEQGQILIARRKEGKSQAGLWEFPGGKIETGENPQACIVRELLEEMNIMVSPGELFGVNEFVNNTMQIRLIAHKAKYIGGQIRLIDHDEFFWAKRDELGHFVFAPADVKFVEMLMLGL